MSDNTEDELSFLQRTFKDRTAVSQALAQDLARQGRQIEPQILLARRIEFVINALFPPYVDGVTEGPMNNLNRIRLELAWLDVVEGMYRAGIRESIRAGSGLIQPKPATPPRGGHL